MQDPLAVVFFAGLLRAPVFTSAGAIGREDERGNLFAERGCCRRQSHFLHIGHDVSGSPVSVDVGKCRSSCLSQQIGSPQPGLLGLSRHSSMLDFLRSKKVRKACRSGIDGCHCSTCPEECLRLPALKTFFPDSPWEVTVDVGKCSDPTYSADGLFCLPTKFSTALVQNPQGGEVVRTLENCEMKEKCYRVSQVEYYYEIVHSSGGRREERLKEIDVGRCLGSCSSGDPCLLGGDTGAVPLLACGDTSLLPQVRDWTEDESSNQGLLVTVQGLGGSPLDPPPLQFASSGDHHESKKPMLVLFTDDGRRGASLPMAGFPGGSHTPWHGSLSAAVPSPEAQAVSFLV
ncbi:uncharacterized protein LOC104125058 [Egretta garzetta]|uniref:uncharacterized protein LOC104125058 n=1 Tax=Egretta garzetta TaxID=188379 RepID=UPI00163BE2E1|nr:uncharacterized protein LOC104125058 [Egretta garzetta]